MKYKVTLYAHALVTTITEVETDNENLVHLLAQEKAKSGDVVWDYAGTDDETIKVGSVTKL